MTDNASQQEWLLLQSQYGHYENYALIIKLFSFILFIVLLQNDFHLSVNLLLIACLWLQEGIWKTYQSRLESRLLLLENKLSNISENDVPAFNLHQSFAKQRPSTTGLIKAYLLNSLRPTVAFPYTIFIVVLFIC